MAIVLYAPSLALNAGNCTRNIYLYMYSSTCVCEINIYCYTYVCATVTGINVWISVFSVGVVCTFYTTLVSATKHCKHLIIMH